MKDVECLRVVEFRRDNLDELMDWFNVFEFYDYKLYTYQEHRVLSLYPGTSDRNVRVMEGEMVHMDRKGVFRRI